MTSKPIHKRTDQTCFREQFARLRDRDMASFSKAVAVGLCQNATFYGVTLLLLWMGWAAWEATMLCYPIGVLGSFLANRYWSFARRPRDVGQLLRYAALYVGIYPVAVGLNWIQENAGIASWLASLLTMAMVAPLMLAALGFWVFSERDA